MNVSSRIGFNESQKEALSERKRGRDVARPLRLLVRSLSVLFVLLPFGSQAWGAAATISVSPSTANTGNYTVSWNVTLGCWWQSVSGGFAVRLCNSISESVNGQITQVISSGTSMTYTNKPIGNYTYTIKQSYNGYPWGTGEVVLGQPVTVQVGLPNYPEPIVTLTNLGPVGPVNNPYYYDFGWTASLTNVNGCRLETSEQIVIDGWTTIVGGYVWDNLPATGNLQISPRYAETTLVFYEMRCTGPGGTGEANGALPF